MIYVYETWGRFCLPAFENSDILKESLEIQWLSPA